MDDIRMKTCRMCGALFPDGERCGCSTRRSSTPMSTAPVAGNARLSCRVLPEQHALAVSVDRHGAITLDRPDAPGVVTSVPLKMPDGSVRRAWVIVAICDEEPEVVFRPKPSA